MNKPRPQTLPNAVATLVAVLCIVLGAALCAGLIGIDRTLPAVETAISAEAMVTHNRIKPGEMSGGKFPRMSPDQYYLHLSFIDSTGRAEAHEVEVGSIDFNTHLPGGTVTVWYFPGRPEVTVLDDPAKLAETGSHWGMLLGGLLLVLGAAMGLHFGNRLFMARRGYSLL
jgi:hypothetical protein